MTSKKASRLDLVEKQIALIGNGLQNMDQALRWALEEINKLKDKDAPENVEVVDPNQLTLDLDAKIEK